ncbi:MAG: phosphosulfolactate synthase [Desulforudis sp.]|nr:phosphosulfolactate synthase [Clostridia bacterium]RJX22672.1 MAG: phosphosulfolactate synthase [Desulforudis sp.]
MDSWREMIALPLAGRSRKPRVQGLSMVLDKGLGLAETKDLLDISANHIDFIKLGFGTSALYADGILQAKINLVKAYGVDIYPGGTFFEVAAAQGKVESFFKLAQSIGFSAIEVSDGTIYLDSDDRRRAIEMGVKFGFKVLAEVGKKDPDEQDTYRELAIQAKKDLEAGAHWVIVEGREFGKNVVIYDESGQIKDSAVEEFLMWVKQPECLLWEAPLKDQQETLINRFGADVNLGNIPPGEILSLEALRVGLRGDTLKRCYR